MGKKKAGKKEAAKGKRKGRKPDLSGAQFFVRAFGHDSGLEANFVAMRTRRAVVQAEIYGDMERFKEEARAFFGGEVEMPKSPAGRRTFRKSHGWSASKVFPMSKNARKDDWMDAHGYERAGW